MWVEINLRNQGSALLTALVIVALAVALTSGIVSYLRIDIARTNAVKRQNEAFIAAQSARNWAVQALTQDWQNQQRNKLPTDWNKLTWHQTFGNYQIVANLKDAQGLYNINNLQDSSRLNSFIKLLQAISPETDFPIAHRIATSINAWLSAGARTNAPLQAIYKKLTPPYSPSGRLFTHSSELLLISSMTSKLYQDLASYIVALPQNTPVNINTANKMVLMTLGLGLTAENAEKIIQLRLQEGGFKTTDQFTGNPLAQAAQITANQITIMSDYFLLRTEIIYPSNKETVTILLKRLIVNGKIQVVPLWEIYG